MYAGMILGQFKVKARLQVKKCQMESITGLPIHSKLFFSEFLEKIILFIELKRRQCVHVMGPIFEGVILVNIKLHSVIPLQLSGFLGNYTNSANMWFGEHHL